MSTNNLNDRHRVTLFVNNKEEQELLDLIKSWGEPGDVSKRTGFEKVAVDEVYYGYDAFEWEAGIDTQYDEESYKNGEYFSNKTVAENMTRAARLLWRLARFAAENDAEMKQEDKEWEITYVVDEHDIEALTNGGNLQTFGIPFSSEYIAKMAMEEFREDLLWYFGTFLPSLNNRY